jgi:hypothetical protein
VVTWQHGGGQVEEARWRWQRGGGSTVAAWVTACERAVGWALGDVLL